MARAWSIAILSCDPQRDRYAQGASWRYRGDNLAHGLSRQGHEVVQGHVADGWRTGPAAVVVLLRPSNSWGLRQRLRAWRRQGTRVVADFDDLVFDPAAAAESPGVLNQRVSLSAVQERFAAHRQVLPLVDACSVSTEALRLELTAAYAALGCHRPVHSLHNAVHWRWRSLPATPWPAHRPLVGYFSGTHSHDRDLAVAEPGLLRALQARPAWGLQLVGRGHFAPDLPTGRWDRVPYLPFDNGYVDALRRTSVSLMPLEATRFNRCKSALKFIESAWWNVPLLASPLPDAERLACAGLLQAARPDDWGPLLTDCLGDPQALQARARGLREHLLAHADIHTIARHWQDWVDQQLEPRPC